MNIDDICNLGIKYIKTYATVARCSYKAGGDIALALFPENRSDLPLLAQADCELRILGNMSNTAVSEEGYDGAVIFSDRLKGVEIIRDTVYLGAGEKLPAVAAKMSALGLSGLEKLSGIPASVGGAVYMNAGAFGDEFAGVVAEVYVWDIKNGHSYILSPREMGFGYRKCNLVAGREMVVGVALKLTEGDNVETTSRLYREKRLALQPKEPSLGSVFKKVGGLSAGWYIDKAGYKKKRIGGAEVSEKHANFFVNTGGGRVADLLALVKEVKSGVKQCFDVKLTEEILIL